MTDANNDTLNRLVRQHAQTSRLMGVDFVPAYSKAGRLTEPPVQSVIEAKPSTPAAYTPSPPSEAEGYLNLPESPDAARQSLDGWKRAPRAKGEDDRTYAARLLVDLQARYEKDAPHNHFVTAHKGATIVFGDGDPGAQLVFVGEAPGEEEDRTGIPFVGRAGQLLNKMIGAMGLSRETVYICNVLKTRPPGNATPTEREAAMCEPYLLEQLAIISPKVIVTLGLPATRLLLRSQDTMTRMRGRWAQATLAGGVTVPVMPTYHPAYVLRSYTAEVRGKVWSDLQMVMDRLGLKGSKAPPA